MMDSFHSLLFAAQPKGLFSDQDLELIESLKDQPARFIFSQLRSELRQQLTELEWERSWEKVVKASERDGLWTESRFCEDYPDALRNLTRPPLLLTVLGEPVWKKHRLINVVGTRNPGRSSTRWMSFHLTSFLRQSDFTVVSGGARGVDQWAHRVSLSVGRGTLSVVPSGLMNLYPSSLQDLAPEIIQGGGALMSIYPVQQPMKKFFFHQRNHLLAALGEATLVIEAGIKSGTLLTAKHCADLGRDLFCLPFSPWEERGAGNNHLLRAEGARAVMNDYDLMEDFLGQVRLKF